MYEQTQPKHDNFVFADLTRRIEAAKTIHKAKYTAYRFYWEK